MNAVMVSRQGYSENLNCERHVSTVTVDWMDLGAKLARKEPIFFGFSIFYYKKTGEFTSENEALSSNEYLMTHEDI